MTKQKSATWYTFWLCICLALFSFRVIAQFIQKFYNLSVLPPFKAWYSGALAYPWLLTSQILIIIVMAYLIKLFAQHHIKPKRYIGLGLLIIGALYFLVMLVRFITGWFFNINHPWLGAHIPAFFHLVLATFILIIGHFHYRHTYQQDGA